MRARLDLHVGTLHTEGRLSHSAHAWGRVQLGLVLVVDPHVGLVVLGRDVAAEQLSLLKRLGIIQFLLIVPVNQVIDTFLDETSVQITNSQVLH